MNRECVRELRVKNDEGFEDPVFLGAHGRFVKMNSGLSLEEAILAGEPTNTTIKKLENGNTQITATIKGKDFNGQSAVNYTSITTISKEDNVTTIRNAISFGSELLFTKITRIVKRETETIITEEIER